MSYLVLARRFRPQTFSSIVGQEHITRAIANAILRGRVPHAFLLTGPRGVGKTTSARVLARALNCSGRALPSPESIPSEGDVSRLIEPCGECVNCIEIARGSSLAVREIDGASHNSVDNVRDLIDSLRSLPPPGSPYKIYIIDEVHMLSTAAFNALLKSLEEPPPNTVFIFATTEPHKIPETVISRCQRHDFRKIPAKVIADTLRHIAAEDRLEAEDDVFEFIAVKAQGGMRDAQSMFDRLIAFSSGKITLDGAQQLFGVVDAAFFFSLSDAVFKQDAPQCFSLLDSAFSQSLEVRTFIAEFVTHWRNLLLVAITKESRGEGAEATLGRMLEIPKRDRDRLAMQTVSTAAFDMQRLFEIAERTADNALNSSFPRYVMEAGLAKMANLPNLRPLGELIAAIEAGGITTPRAVSPAVHAAEAVTTEGESTPRPFAKRAPMSAQDPREAQDLPVSYAWQDFLAHLKRSRAEMLVAFLRRASVKSFAPGILAVEAPEFDVTTLRDPEKLSELRKNLIHYSKISEWDIRFIVHEGMKPQQEAAVSPPLGKQASANALPIKRRAAGPIPGSLADIEAQEDIRRVQQVESEARSNPLVKAALKTFEGSTIERVAVLAQAKGDSGSK